MKSRVLPGTLAPPEVSLRRPDRGDGVAEREDLVGGSTHHDLAGVDPRPCLKLDPDPRRELPIELAQRVSHVAGSPHRAQGIVLMHRRNTEDGQDRVADELLDGATVGLDRRAHPLEVAKDELAPDLGIYLLGERRGSDDVREDDRGGLSLLGDRAPDRVSARIRPDLKRGRTAGERRAPQAEQKRASSALSLPLDGQAVTAPV